METASIEFGGILSFDCKGAISSVATQLLSEKVEKSFEYYILAKGITYRARKKVCCYTGTEVQELLQAL